MPEKALVPAFPVELTDATDITQASLLQGLLEKPRKRTEVAKPGRSKQKRRFTVQIHAHTKNLQANREDQRRLPVIVIAQSTHKTVDNYETLTILCNEVKVSGRFRMRYKDGGSTVGASVWLETSGTVRYKKGGKWYKLGRKSKHWKSWHENVLPRAKRDPYAPYAWMRC